MASTLPKAPQNEGVDPLTKGKTFYGAEEVVEDTEEEVTEQGLQPTTDAGHPRQTIALQANENAYLATSFCTRQHQTPGGFFGYAYGMGQPNIDNVVYIDEYPHLEEKVRLRRMGQLVLFEPDNGHTVLTLFDLPEDTPDGAAQLSA